jgi:hypothetical protein
LEAEQPSLFLGVLERRCSDYVRLGTLSDVSRSASTTASPREAKGVHLLQPS